MSPPLEVLNVRRSYGAGRGLVGVSLSVAAGEIYGLLGPNGAGKTSLVRAITGRLRLEGGSVRLSGRDPADAAARTRQTADEQRTNSGRTADQQQINSRSTAGHSEQDGHP